MVHSIVEYASSVWALTPIPTFTTLNPYKGEQPDFATTIFVDPVV